MARVIGLDIGERWLGVAVGDDILRIATPRPERRVESASELEAAISELVAAERAAALILGMPYTMRGEIGPQGALLQALADTLRATHGIPVYLVDERLTSKQAQKIPRAAPKRRMQSKPVAEREDSTAAALILQTWFDQLG